MTEKPAAVALQGPLSRARARGGDRRGRGPTSRYFRRRAGARSAGSRWTSRRTGYTGDLGYELWVDGRAAVDVWDALIDAGRAYGIRPAGHAALDVVRVEAGLILLEVDYTSVRHALIAEQAYSPFEIGLGPARRTSTSRQFVGRRALLRGASARAGRARRLVGLELDWDGIERLFARHGPAAGASRPTVSREPVPVFGRPPPGRPGHEHRWSPMLKKMIALASVGPRTGRRARRSRSSGRSRASAGTVAATVVELPFLDLPRRRETG